MKSSYIVQVVATAWIAAGFASSLSAQGTIVVNGSVTVSRGSRAGVTVIAKTDNGQQTVQTDKDGNYAVTVASGIELGISYSGPSGRNVIDGLFGSANQTLHVRLVPFGSPRKMSDVSREASILKHSYMFYADLDEPDRSQYLSSLNQDSERAIAVWNDNATKATSNVDKQRIFGEVQSLEATKTNVSKPRSGASATKSSPD